MITSEANDLYLDAPEFEPFWTECEKLGLFVFVHPALKLNQTKQFDGYDTARSVGREFSLVMATIRLINSGVLDRHPNLMIHMSHLGGGLSALLGRIRSYQDKDFWGTADNARHGAKAKQDFDYYIRNNFVFDTAGFCGAHGRGEERADRDPGVAHRVRHRLSAGNPRPIGGRRFRQGIARARQGRRGDPVRQCRQADQGAREGGVRLESVMDGRA